MNENFLDGNLKVIASGLDLLLGKRGEAITLEKKTYQTSKLFSILFPIWCIDFITTVIALNFFEGFIEINPIPNWLFSFGVIGWIFAFLYSFILILLLSYFIIRVINMFKNENFKLSLYVLSIILFIILESFTIVNNINLMLNSL